MIWRRVSLRADNVGLRLTQPSLYARELERSVLSADVLARETSVRFSPNRSKSGFVARLRSVR
jgi:hypothetical protein